MGDPKLLHKIRLGSGFYGSAGGKRYRRMTVPKKMESRKIVSKWVERVRDVVVVAVVVEDAKVLDVSRGIMSG